MKFMTLPICAVTGRIAGDSDACGDCDPCGAAHAVPDAVKNLLAEKDEWRGKYSEAMSELDDAKDVLRRSGFQRCDLPACNCGSWHQVGGFKARFDEIKEVVEEAGYSTNGRTLLAAVKLALNIHK